MPLLEVLLPAAINAAGSLLGGGDDAPQGINFKRLRRDAKRGGFNPLTALMATGGAGYQAPSAPSLSSAEFIASTLAEGVSTYFANQRQDMLLAKADEDEARLRAEYAAQMAMPRSNFGPSLTADLSDPAYSVPGAHNPPLPGSRPSPFEGGAAPSSVDYQPGMKCAVQPNGERICMPVGWDMDEMVTGAVLWVGGQAQQKLRWAGLGAQQVFEQYQTRIGPVPMPSGPPIDPVTGVGYSDRRNAGTPYVTPFGVWMLPW